MAKRKADSFTKVRQGVYYPKYNTLEEQKAFQLGLATAFSATAECQNATAKAIIEKGEEILRDMGCNVSRFSEVEDDN